MNIIIRRGGPEASANPVSTSGMEDVAVERMIEQIAKSLVDQPDLVEVNAVNGNRTMVLELRVAKEDVGKVIGRHGQTANAMRILLAAVSSKMAKRTVLEILE